MAANKTEKFGKLVRSLLQMFLSVILMVSPKVLVNFLNISRNVFTSNFLMLVYEEPLRRSMKRKNCTLALTKAVMVAEIPMAININISDYSQRKFFLYGFPDFMIELILFCDKSTIFFDVGANLGLISLAVAQRIEPMNIFAFEPMSESYKKLVSNFVLNCPTAKSFQYALSDKTEKCVMAVPISDSGNASIEVNYIKKRLVDQKIYDKIITEKCNCITFDEFLLTQQVELSSPKIKKVAMKIDVESHEFKVLSGMKEFLKRTDLEILLIIEVHYHNLIHVLQLLNELGFMIRFDSLESLQNINAREYGAARDILFHKSAHIAHS